MLSGLIRYSLDITATITANPCGSWLASDGGISATSMLDVLTSSLASQLPQRLGIK
jgi:hypothetical protein